jgi:LysR family transcriptional regulator of gallate degradation
MEPNLRRMRALLAVARHQRVARAAPSLNVSQPAVTHAIKRLEQDVGQPLFDRTRDGMVPTVFGRILAERSRRAFAQIDLAETEIARAAAAGGVARRADGRLSRDISLRQLKALIAVAECHSVTFAAHSLGLSQPAVNRAFRDLERFLGIALFDRTPQGMIPTWAGSELVRRAKLALAELRYADDEIAQVAGIGGGRVTVGTLPLCRTVVVPRAVTRLMEVSPRLRVATVDGPYENLLAGLRCGDIDVIVGALREPPPVDDVIEEFLFEDKLSLFVRADHPLARRKRIDLEDLCDSGWILPREGIPSRMRFATVLEARGLPQPSQVIETSSLVVARGILMESDRIALVSRHQAFYEDAYGMLKALPLDLPGTDRRIGLTLRANAFLSPGAQAMVEGLRAVATEIRAAPFASERVA